MSDDVDRDKSILVSHTFNSVEIIEIEYQGRPVFVAQQVGDALGYADSKQLADNIARKWSEDFEEGRDFIKLTNGALASFKAAVNYPADQRVVEVDQSSNRRLVDPKASQLVLLTEAGAQLAAILSRTPQGRSFRRWLIDVVLPAYRARHAPPPPPSRQRRQVAGPRGQRQLAGPVARPEELIRAAMLATNPQGPRAEGSYLDSLVNTFNYARRHKAELEAGRMSRRRYLSLKVRDAGAWVEWRIDTGMDIETADRFAALLAVLVETCCGPVPGWDRATPA